MAKGWDAEKMSKARILEVARRILAGTIDPLEGCRWIVRHQAVLTEEERMKPHLVTLVGIESETDDLPMGAVRAQWEPRALAEQDRRRAEYLGRYEADLREACAALVTALGPAVRYGCPCCGHLTLRSQPPGSFELCPVCYWEDDSVQAADPTYEGGANRESMNQARANFLAFGASSPEAVGHVRPPLGEEQPDDEP